MKNKFSLVIPFYNEEECAEKVVNELVNVFNIKKADYEIIMIDNGSNDSTDSILKKLSSKHKNLNMISFEENRKFGSAIIEGMKIAKGDFIGFSCGDGEVSAEDVYNVYSYIINNNVELCKPIRTSRKDGLFRRISSYSYNLLVILLFNLNVTDVNAYPLIMKREIYKKINPNIGNWLFNLDILYKAKLNNILLDEKIKITHRKRVAGKSHFLNFLNFFKVFNMFIDLIEYRIKVK